MVKCFLVNFADFSLNEVILCIPDLRISYCARKLGRFAMVLLKPNKMDLVNSVNSVCERS